MFVRGLLLIVYLLIIKYEQIIKFPNWFVAVFSVQSCTLFGRMKNGRPFHQARSTRSGTDDMISGCWQALFGILGDELLSNGREGFCVYNLNTIFLSGFIMFKVHNQEEQCNKKRRQKLSIYSCYIKEIFVTMKFC